MGSGSSQTKVNSPDDKSKQGKKKAGKKVGVKKKAGKKAKPK